MTSELTAVTDSPDVGTRRGGLIGWGVLLIVLGTVVGLAAFGAVFAATDMLEEQIIGGSRLPRGRRGAAMPAVTREHIVGILVMLAVTTGLVWTGIASCLCRRWVRPAVMVGAVSVCVVSLLVVTAQLLSLPHLLNEVDTARWERQRHNLPTSGSVLTVACIRIGITLALGVVLPWIAYRFYLSQRTRDALDRLDPRLAWTDRCAPPLLGWAMWTGLMGVLLLLSLTSSPRLLAFVVVLTGASATIGLCVLGIIMLWAAALCYRRDRWGWMLSFLLMIGLRASIATYYWLGNTPDDLFPKRSWAARAFSPELVPWWLPATMATLEGALLAAFALYAARFLDSSPKHR